jgi:hypothetical protein
MQPLYWSQCNKRVFWNFATAHAAMEFGETAVHCCLLLLSLCWRLPALPHGNWAQART